MLFAPNMIDYSTVIDSDTLSSRWAKCRSHDEVTCEQLVIIRQKLKINFTMLYLAVHEVSLIQNFDGLAISAFSTAR